MAVAAADSYSRHGRRKDEPDVEARMATHSDKKYSKKNVVIENSGAIQEILMFCFEQLEGGRKVLLMDLFEAHIL